eukprot:143155-Chlamydomonas_euryale.AAC.4
MQLAALTPCNPRPGHAEVSYTNFRQWLNTTARCMMLSSGFAEWPGHVTVAVCVCNFENRRAAALQPTLSAAR